MAMREYRKGNWTVEETMILIEAKKKDDERRKLNRSKQTLASTTSPSSSGSGSSSKPVTELRWKWVEEYCWGKGCFRSQNQCNDKWDNLMRDYKKVRDYQKSLIDSTYNNNTSQQTSSNTSKSYWSMDKTERKEKGLPTNMLPQIYQALFDVVESCPTTTAAAAVAFTVIPPTTTSFLLPPPPPQPPVPALQILPPSPSLPPVSSGFLPSQQLPTPQPPALEAGTSEQHAHDPESSQAKRRRKEGGGAAAIHAATPAMTTTMAVAGSSLEEVSTAICKSATMLSEAIQASEEKQERRHKEMMNMHESRLRIEESKFEINRQGLSGLTDAINRLATSIFTWSNSHKNQQGP